MAEETETGQKMPGIARVGSRKRGYDVDQVDAFLDRAHAMYDSDRMPLTLNDIQNAAFHLVNGGYAIGQVDAALARLGRAVADKQTARELNEQGNEGWKARTRHLYRVVENHAERPAKHRFARGERKRISYDVKQVDQLVNMVVDKIALGLGMDDDIKQSKKLDNLSSTSVSNSIFTQRKGSRGYDQRQVDYFLSYCVDLLNRIESYNRLDGYQQSVGSAGAFDGAPSAPVPVAAVPAPMPNSAADEQYANGFDYASGGQLEDDSRDEFAEPFNAGSSVSNFGFDDDFGDSAVDDSVVEPRNAYEQHSAYEPVATAYEPEPMDVPAAPPAPDFSQSAQVAPSASQMSDYPAPPVSAPVPAPAAFSATESFAPSVPPAPAPSSFDGAPVPPQPVESDVPAPAAASPSLAALASMGQQANAPAPAAPPAPQFDGKSADAGAHYDDALYEDEQSDMGIPNVTFPGLSNGGNGYRF